MYAPKQGKEWIAISTALSWTLLLGLGAILATLAPTATACGGDAVTGQQTCDDPFMDGYDHRPDNNCTPNTPGNCKYGGPNDPQDPHDWQQDGEDMVSWGLWTAWPMDN